MDGQSGPENNRPREFYEIVQNDAVTYRVASGARDIVYEGNTYVAEPVARTAVGISTVTGEFQVTLALPLRHGLCQRYPAAATPPRQIAVTIRRLDLESGLVEQIWSGYVTSMAIERHIGKFNIPSKMVRSLQRKVPSLVVGTLCPHTLYDKQCRIDPATFSVSTTVARFDGRSITLVTVAAFGDENFALFGDITHDNTGERQTVFKENGSDFDGTTTFEMQAMIPEIQVGDSVTVRAGCLHDIPTCHDKFANVANYGGMPERPTSNPFTPTVIGFNPP